ncbi:MAG: hypothetical protein A2636_00845 [Elusimicrobia bacterium RIFCSPHIGHO2_01_FULL_64_10]|nr:MAG: hypothetical protein A2636_00845 [Elusimicrobia bacterium RIFCSPHIGHO2_01_FULL_64_10]
MFDLLRSFFRKWLARKAPLELSYSKISAYRFCPWKYKLLYHDGRRVPPNPHISLGQSVHKALEEFHKREGKTLDELLEAYDKVWVNEGFQNPQQTQHFYEKGEKMLRQYIDWFHLRKSEVVAVEREFRFPVGTRILRGMIDRIDRLPDDTYEVIDYKTHAEMWEQSRIDSDLQLTLYSIGCRQLMKAEPSLLSYFFLAHNKVVTTARSSVQYREAIAEFESGAEKIEAGSFPPDVSKCPRCDFKSTCAYSSDKAPKGNGKSKL